ncbi:hypothetical protein [Bacillus taeanensis]|uniref:Uncharacterized protein n=1 Tax=Bacillus taeanensis TaxID=273032 RepID=A0A366Y0S6_9BACI|nr:hypothetical protein [Bacillus taeanensis]RBW69771.1 hypothetical protein DS031_09570 [Bacillus taeanensis]
MFKYEMIELVDEKVETLTKVVKEYEREYVELDKVDIWPYPEAVRIAVLLRKTELEHYIRESQTELKSLLRKEKIHGETN